MNSTLFFLALLTAKLLLGLAILLWRFPWLLDALPPALGGPELQGGAL